MASNGFASVIDVSADTFSTAVLQKSSQLPVLVDFWAAWCQPCQLLTPLLQNLAESYQGAFILAKVNADREQQLAAQFGVRGLPTVKVFRHGQVVEELVGLQPESVYRAVIERYRAKASTSLLEQAEAAWQRGDQSKALALLGKAHELEPDDSEISLTLADKLIASKQAEEAKSVLDQLPALERLQEPASALFARLDFLSIAASGVATPVLEQALRDNPDDCSARRQLGARKVVEQDYQGALEQFLEIMRRDPRFDDEAGRKGLLGIFAILGSDHALVVNYRRKMSMLMH